MTYSKRPGGVDGTAHETEFEATFGGTVEVGVVAGPSGVLPRAARRPQPAHNVADGQTPNERAVSHTSRNPATKRKP
jgi:hypothetical protein